MFVARLTAKFFTPSPFLTIDEMLAVVRGRCRFKVYMPLKPGKYGLKIELLTDAKHRYVLNAIPYVGKAPEEERPRNYKANLETVKKLVFHFKNTGRNINRGSGIHTNGGGR